MQSLDHINKASLSDSSGRTYLAFRASLRPRRLRMAFDLVLGYAASSATALLIVWACNAMPGWWPAWTALGAVSFGYWMAYLQLFIHEAAHFHLLANRTWNDRLANLLIAAWVGAHIENYRAVHWEHHRQHGEPTDTEHSYFAALDAKFIAAILLGVRALTVILYRNRLNRTADVQQAAPRRRQGMWLLATVLHGALLVGFCVAGHWQVALAWISGIGMFLPFFGALRQLLEHRSEQASAAADYFQVPHGRTTRLFREGIFASTFGAAGFTRHLLHHWDPSVSYTNLAEVEGFLASCAGTNAIRSHKTTYLRAFIALYGR